MVVAPTPRFDPCTDDASEREAPIRARWNGMKLGAVS